VKTCVIVEARMTSTRLPGKVLMTAAGKPMLEHEIERLRRCRNSDGVVIATTVNRQDDPVAGLCGALDVPVFRGSEEDVLGRVLGAARAFHVDVIVEVPGDCPLVDPAYVDLVIADHAAGGADYVASVLRPTFPPGTEAQVFATAILAETDGLTSDPLDREHVSRFIYRHPERYRLRNVAAPAAVARPDLKLTLDTADDYARIKSVFEALWPVKPDFGLADTIAFLDGR
jgi:spore coat polysaccharide biosynthesis protein SpsF